MSIIQIVVFSDPTMMLRLNHIIVCSPCVDLHSPCSSVYTRTKIVFVFTVDKVVSSMECRHYWLVSSSKTDGVTTATLPSWVENATCHHSWPEWQFLLEIVVVIQDLHSIHKILYKLTSLVASFIDNCLIEDGQSIRFRSKRQKLSCCQVEAWEYSE